MPKWTDGALNILGCEWGWQEWHVVDDVMTPDQKIDVKLKCGHWLHAVVKPWYAPHMVVNELGAECEECLRLATVREAIDTLVALVKAVVLVWAQNLDATTKRMSLLELN